VLHIERKKIVLAIGLALFGATAAAEDKQLQEVVVKGQNFAPDQSAFTVNVVEQETIRERQVTRMQDLFREVPGMAVRNFGLGGVADSVVMRGFGDGGHGGDVGMAIDGIPLNEAMSHADGYADQNVIIPLEVDRMTVYKGPSSALYGNYSRAGVIAIESRKGGEYRELDVKAGSFSTLDTQAAIGTRVGPAQGNFAAQFYTTDGFRQQSHARRGTVSGRLGFDLGGGTQLSVSGRAHEGKWDSAGYITGAQNDNPAERFNKDPRMQNDGGQKTFYTGRVDLSTPLATELRLLAFAYGTQQTFSRYFTRPTSLTAWNQRLEDYDRNVRGAGASLNGLNRLAGKELNWVIGAEGYHENTRYIFKDALNNRAETAATINGSNPYLNRDYLTNSVSAFGQAEWNLAKTFRPMLGLRHDRFSGDCSVRGTEIAAGGNPCRSMAGYSQTSPKLGVRSTWSPMVDTRASISEGFQLPAAEARYGVSGASVQPTKIRQMDVGLTLKPFKGAVVDLSLFRIDTRNEVRDIGGGEFENFGKTRRDGIEIDAHFSPTAKLDLSAALTWLNTRVLQHADPSVVGKAIPGVPDRTATLRGRYRFADGWSADLAIQHVNGFPVNAGNTATMAGYTTADLTVAWERLGSAGNQRYFIGISNLTDRAYTTSSSVMRGVQVYAPGAPRSVMLGVNLSM
jgi:outer membrane receptor protein involved in Fe transport